MQTKSSILRTLLTQPDLTFLMEAHNGLSAKIVEETGFRGIWASGLTISASFGVRDNNELSWSQVVDHVAFMAEATTLPILLDGDTGYGNFNNMRRLVRKLEQTGVAGVTIEDKLFPKTNSFLRAERQPLADVDEFCGKLKAGKDQQSDPDFVIVARVEALIAGWGLQEALRRAEAYHLAGADAILMHSRQSSPAEIFEFLEAWGRRSPVVLVPTKYWRTPTAEYRARGVSVVIWANHLLRSAVDAMRSTARVIHEEQSLLNVEPQVASLADVFRLQGDEELAAAEKRYLPDPRDPLSAVILAAAAGTGFAGLTDATPKAMLKVQGRPILTRLIDDLAHAGCHAITVVRGHRPEAVVASGVQFIDNPDFATTGEGYSLSLAEAKLGPGTLVAFGDIVIKRHILHALLEDAGTGITAVVDSTLAGAGEPDRVLGDRPDAERLTFGAVHMKAIGDAVSAEQSHGAWIGLLHLGADGAGWLRDAIHAARTDGTLGASRISDLLTRVLAAGHPIRVIYTRGGWVNVNDIADLIDASGI